jgi:hypothetical protein
MNLELALVEKEDEMVEEGASFVKKIKVCPLE